MKKIIVLFLIFIPALVFSQAGNPKRTFAEGIPQFVKDAVKKAPADALIGVGVARAPTLSMGRTLAETRARAEISRQLNSITQVMIREHTVTSETNPSEVLVFQERITITLSKSNLVGAETIEVDRDDTGRVWVVVQFMKTDASREINDAQSAVKQEVQEAMFSFDAIERLDSAFERELLKEIVFSGS